MTLVKAFSVLIVAVVLALGVGLTRHSNQCQCGCEAPVKGTAAEVAITESDLKTVTVRHSRCGHEANYMVIPGDYFTTTCAGCGHLFMISPQ